MPQRERWFDVAFGAAALVAIGTTLWLSSGLTFFLDEWRFIAAADDWSFGGLMDPYNQHWGLVEWRLVTGRAHRECIEQPQRADHGHVPDEEDRGPGPPATHRHSPRGSRSGTMGGNDGQRDRTTPTKLRTNSTMANNMSGSCSSPAGPIAPISLSWSSIWAVPPMQLNTKTSLGSGAAQHIGSHLRERLNSSC